MSRQIACDQCGAVRPETSTVDQNWRRVAITSLDAGVPILNVEVCSDTCAAEAADWHDSLEEPTESPKAKRKTRAKAT